MVLLAQQSAPSWKSGFARSAGESANPGLWTRIAGAWFSGFGPTGTVLKDISGFNNDGTLQGMDAATDWVVGEKGYALEFDGVNDNISTPSSSRYDADGHLTIVTTVKLNAGSTDDFARLVERSEDDTDGISIAIRQAATPFLDVRITSGTTEYWVLTEGASNAQLTDGEWDTVAVVFDGSATLIYLNGIQVSTATQGGGSILSGTDLRFCDASDNSARQFAGQMSNVLIYKRALTPNEIQQLYIDSLAPFRRKRIVGFSTQEAVGATDGRYFGGQFY